MYRILGEPSQVVESPPEEINWFKDAGLTITLDSVRNVSGITIHGPWNRRRFSTYQEPVLSGLRVTDKVVDFFTKFGRPVQRKDRWHESEASVVWQRAHLLIEVTYWTMETQIGASGTSVNVGELSRIDITPAPRSQ